MTMPEAEKTTRTGSSPISYPVERDGMIQSVQLPFVVGVMADLSSTLGESSMEPSDRQFVMIESGSLDAYLQQNPAGVRIDVPELDTSSSGSGSIAITIESIAAMDPDAMDEQIRQALNRSAGQPLSHDGRDVLVQRISRHPSLNRLLESLRGLQSLTDLQLQDPAIKIKVLDISHAELVSDRHRATSDENTILYKLVFRNEFGVFGGEPYAMVVTNFQFSHEDHDLAVLDNMAKVGAQAGCLFISSTSSRFVGVDDWQCLDDSKHANEMFCSKPYLGWREFRDSEPARYLAMTVPITTGESVLRAQSGSEVFILCEALIKELSSEAEMTDKGIRVFAADEITSELIPILTDNGLTPIEAASGGLFMPIEQVLTVQRARRYHQAEKSGVARLLTHVLYNLRVNRFLRYITSITRDQIGAFMGLDALEEYLNNWVMDYVGNESNSSAPLSDASIKVQEVMGSPGTFKVQLQIKLRHDSTDSPPYTSHEAYVLGLW